MSVHLLGGSLLLAGVSAALAQTAVYRCFNEYTRVPSNEGRVVDTTDSATTAARRAETRASLRASDAWPKTWRATVGSLKRRASRRWPVASARSCVDRDQARARGEACTCTEKEEAAKGSPGR